MALATAGCKRSEVIGGIGKSVTSRPVTLLYPSDSGYPANVTSVPADQLEAVDRVLLSSAPALTLPIARAEDAQCARCALWYPVSQMIVVIAGISN